MLGNYFAYSLVVMLLLFSCNIKRASENCEAIIHGKWVSVEETINYDALFFLPNNTAIFTSKGDTIFRYDYKVNCSRSKLLLSDVYGNKYEHQIKLLSNDSLFFKKFFHSNGMVKYIRVSSK